MGDYICNFSLNNQEHLYLFDSDMEETIEELDIPKMSSKKTLKQGSDTKNHYFFHNGIINIFMSVIHNFMTEMVNHS